MGVVQSFVLSLTSQNAFHIQVMLGPLIPVVDFMFFFSHVFLRPNKKYFSKKEFTVNL